MAKGVSVVAQDGAGSNTPCANESHAHHHRLNDSIWQQYQAVRRTFNTYLTTPMRDHHGQDGGGNRLRPPSVGGAQGMLQDGSPVPTVGASWHSCNHSSKL